MCLCFKITFIFECSSRLHIGVSFGHKPHTTAGLFCDLMFRGSFGNACQTAAVLPQRQETMWLAASSVNCCWPFQKKRHSHTLTGQMVFSVNEPGLMSA